MQQFNINLQNVASEVWTEGRGKIRSKLEFLVRKRLKPRQEVPDELDGILISDSKLRAKFPDPVIEPLVSEGLTVSASEKKALLVTPGTNTYEPISMDKMAVATEAALDKLRWERRNIEEREGEAWTEEWELEKLKESTVWDPETNTMDHAKLRATNLKFCRRVIKPNPGKENEEVIYASMKAEIESVTAEYRANNCDDKGRQKSQNLDKETRDSLKSLNARQKAGEGRVQVTDKSGQFWFAPTEEYVASLQPHIVNDPVITLKDRDHIEDVLNAHGIQMARILRMGETHGHETRVQSAVRNHECHAPVLSGMPKDHKVRADGGLSMP